MTLSGFISKLNWRLIVVHLVAYWFLYYALWHLRYLYDYHFTMDFYNRYQLGKKGLDSWQDFDVKRLTYDMMVSNLIPMSGLLVTFVLSLFISIKKKWFWVNSVIVFLLVLSLMVLWTRLKIQITPWTYLKYVFGVARYFPLKWAAYLIITGSTLLIIGAFLFFWERVNRFTDGKKALVSPTPIADTESDTQPA